jgi:2-succinyl-5-enolpyruvyl-6-hydroxy-3-cyclohexene-1-carboxylate synthase
MNALGNRHVGNNLRIMVVNNGKGTEFRQYNSVAAHFGEQANEFISASGHFGNKSPTLIKHYAQELGLKYISASSKEEFESIYGEFLTSDLGGKSVVFEVFTDSDEESRALEIVRNTIKENKKTAKVLARKILGEKALKVVKKTLGKQ